MKTKINILILTLAFVVLGPKIVFCQIPDHLSGVEKEKVLDLYKEYDNELEKEGQLSREQKEKADRQNKEIGRRITSGETTEYSYQKEGLGKGRSGKSQQTNAPSASSVASSTNTLSVPPKPTPTPISYQISFRGYPASLTSPGHAYVVLETQMSDGSVRIKEVGKYPDGVRIKYSLDNLNEVEYFSRNITSIEYKQVWGTVKNELGIEYKYVEDNCVEFVDRIAESLDLKTPDRSSWTFPTNYLERLTYLNSDEKLKLDEASKNSKAVKKSNCSVSVTPLNIDDLPPGVISQ